jgi:hypothetical protein
VRRELPSKGLGLPFREFLDSLHRSIVPDFNPLACLRQVWENAFENLYKFVFTLERLFFEESTSQAMNSGCALKGDSIRLLLARQ